jgi:hypothetical protein
LVGECDAADTVELAASELAGNAIKHSDSGVPGGQFRVHLAAFRDRWQVRVDDEGETSVPHICEPMPIRRVEDLHALGEEVETGRSSDVGRGDVVSVGRAGRPGRPHGMGRDLDTSESDERKR